MTENSEPVADQTPDFTDAIDIPTVVRPPVDSPLSRKLSEMIAAFVANNRTPIQHGGAVGRKMDTTDEKAVEKYAIKLRNIARKIDPAVSVRYTANDGMFVFWIVTARVYKPRDKSQTDQASEPVADPAPEPTPKRRGK